MAATNPTLSPEQTFQFVIDYIRSYLRDYPELNRLLDEEETDNRQLQWQIIGVLDDISNTPPPLGRYDITQVPLMILVKGVLAEVMMSVAVLNLRNSLRYTDGQISVDLDKYQALVSLSQIFRGEYDAKLRNWKTSQNVSQCYQTVTGVHSEYYYLAAGYYGNYT